MHDVQLGEIVYYASLAARPSDIGHIGMTSKDGGFISPFSGYSLAEPGPDDVVIRTDEIKTFVDKFVETAKASDFYGQPATRVKSLVDQYEETGAVRRVSPNEAKLTIFRQVAADYDYIRRVAFYEFMFVCPAPQNI